MRVWIGLSDDYLKHHPGPGQQQATYLLPVIGQPRFSFPKQSVKALTRLSSSTRVGALCPRQSLTPSEFLQSTIGPPRWAGFVHHLYSRWAGCACCSHAAACHRLGIRKLSKRCWALLGPPWCMQLATYRGTVWFKYL